VAEDRCSYSWPRIKRAIPARRWTFSSLRAIRLDGRASSRNVVPEEASFVQADGRGRATTAARELQDGTGRHVEKRSIGLMSLPVIVAAAVAIFVLAMVAVGVRVHRSRARPERRVTEADARAHASPLTRSVLSVTTRSRPDRPGGADT